MRSCSIFVCSQLSKAEKVCLNRYSMQSHLSQLPPARHSIRCCCSETSCCSFFQCEAPHSQIWKFNNHHSPAHAIRFHVQTTLSLLVVSWRANLCFSEISEKTNLFADLASLIRFISTIMRFYSVWFWIRMWTKGALQKMERPSRKRCDELKVLRRCWCCELRY